MNIKQNDKQLAQIIWDYMRYERSLEKADIIIGLGSTDVRTAEWCGKLYHEGYAPLILFTGARGRMTREAFTENEADVYAKRAIELGVPENAILKEDRATNTGENILFAHKLLEEKGISANSLILVTKPYILRRAYATFMKQWPTENKPNIRCSAIDVSFEKYCQDEMYPFEYVTNVIVGDLERIREYSKQGFQIKQIIPDEVNEAFNALVSRGYTKHLL